MAKFCPIINSRVVYLECKECEERNCENQDVELTVEKIMRPKNKIEEISMIDNEKRSDKFIPMNREQFNLCTAFALRNGDRKVCYCKIEDDIYYGGMANTFKEALEWCKTFYEENPDCDLKIVNYSGSVSIWDKHSILYELGIITIKKIVPSI
ncbi:hypothetical protein [Alkaliphilus sp. B6464]|uniref:hypothetical protein n=1 Tax=Alkaliphilus sp. B6464 TaxID=2731219 RepID=UPI001BACC0BC|nr:hypothetical protein [Alkaliphilus sp. B6464]QUH21938.1 hypothetical protein HYG84_18700 [Alkaliphilus sp. B6464]